MPTTTTSAGSSAPDEVITQPTGQPSRESPAAGSLPETSAGRNVGRRLAEAEHHAVLAVQRRELLAQLGAERAVERGRLRLDDGDGASGLPRGGGGLEADPAGPDDHDLHLRLERGPEGVGLLQGPQVEHVAQVGPGDGELPGRGAGGDRELVVGEPAAVEGDRAGGAVDRGNRSAQPQVDVVLGVPGAGVDEDRVAFVLAQQVALGQRGALVRALRLVAEEHDLAVEPLVAERLGRLRARQPAAHDHECRHCRLQRVNPSRRCRR